MRPAESFVVNLIEFQSGEVTLVITGVPSQTVSSMQALEALGDLSLTSQCSLSEQSQDMECPESFMDQSDQTQCQSTDPGLPESVAQTLVKGPTDPGATTVDLAQV